MIPIGFFIIGFGILLISSQNFFKTTNLRRYVDLNLWLKIFFSLFIISVILSSINNLLSQTLLIFPIGMMYLAFTFVLLHSSITLGNKNTIIFFTLSLFFGFFSEYLGVKYGLIFGNYYYNMPGFFLDTVPIMTPISWAIIIYMSYGLTNFILYNSYGEKPEFTKHKITNFLALIFVLSAIDGLCAMNLDMIMDPIAVLPSVASWVWIGGGPYFNVPISNFIGWFVVTFVATIIFRFYESFSLREKIPTHKKLYVFIPALYFLYFIDQSTFAFNHGKNLEIILIGVAAMFPFILISLLLILKKGIEARNEKHD